MPPPASLVLRLKSEEQMRPDAGAPISVALVGAGNCAVAVAVEGDPQIGAHVAHRAAQLFEIGVDGRALR